MQMFILATGLLLVCPVCFCHLSTSVKTLPYLLFLPSWTAERLCVNVRVKIFFILILIYFLFPKLNANKYVIYFKMKIYVVFTSGSWNVQERGINLMWQKWQTTNSRLCSLRVSLGICYDDIIQSPVTSQKPSVCIWGLGFWHVIIEVPQGWKYRAVHPSPQVLF